MEESLMSANHNEQYGSPNVQKPEGSWSKASRREFLQFAAASAVALSASAPPDAFGASAFVEPQGAGTAATRPRTKFLVDCHVHVGAAPSIAPLAASTKSPKDWALARTKYPTEFAKAMTESVVDNSDILVGSMDRHGVTHAVIQAAPGNGSSNQLVLEIAKKYPGRLFPLYRPEYLLAEAGTEGVSITGSREEFARTARRVADEIQDHATRGMVGVGEMTPVTSEIHPIEISRAMAPVMEVLSARGLSIQLPTGYTGWKGGLWYIYMPVWVDELAGNFPKAPIVLTKMGRALRASFDACTVVAMRNSNVYFDMTDTAPEHLREAITRLGAHRIMFGTDLSGVSVNYAHDEGLKVIRETRLSAEEWEQIAWRTVNQVYKLGLKG
jgi:predicted TIM-barrel fold metal-dependent hydrolase